GGAGDRSQLARVVGNLLSNAAKHTPVGTTVTASVREDRPRPGLMLVSVHDDGGGIPADRHATLFHRFVRGPGKGRTGPPGTEPSTGLGLAIVRSIARSHGGDVTVASEGGWTRFDVV
ncbi:sensor histidine kinase, partial [Aquicoccus sp. SCR17]|nr:sensor histidine kinase [Carideicomes alvinocaridis]